MGACCPSGESQSHLRGNLMRNRKTGNITEYYEFVRSLGEGSMGSVARVRAKGDVVNSMRSMDAAHGGSSKGAREGGADEKKADEGAKGLARGGGKGQDFALKTIQLNRISNEMIAELKNEIDILRAMDHPNIIRPREVFYRQRQIYFVMELCDGGDLYVREPYTESQACRIVNQVLSAVQYMHSHGVVHRDIKFENILYENRRPDALVKLIDFGLSKMYTGKSRMKESVGTLYSMAPEVLRGSYTEACDLWSVGVIMFMLLSSQMPFDGADEYTVIRRIERADYSFSGSRWMHVSDDAKNVINHLLRVNPRKRYTAEQALHCRWLRDRRSITNVELEKDKELNHSIADSLRRFGQYGQFRKAVLMVVAHRSNVDQVATLRRVFQNYDRANTGTISVMELREALASEGIDEAEMSKIFEGVDVDATGRIAYTEFLAATIETMGFLEEERLAEAFDRLDSDDSGYITRQNLKELLGADYNRDAVQAMIEEADVTNDGKIDYSEFLQLMRQDPDRTKEMQELHEMEEAFRKKWEEEHPEEPLPPDWKTESHSVPSSKRSLGSYSSIAASDRSIGPARAAHEAHVVAEEKKGEEEGQGEATTASQKDSHRVDIDGDNGNGDGGEDGDGGAKDDGDGE